MVTFGSYEQDGDESNGKEPIEWIVLSKEDNTAMLISKYGLDVKPYNTEFTDVTWETCTLRQWLNGEFYNTAFSAEEQAMIQTTHVTADKNPDYSTDPGNDTEDKVYLLSITEVNKYFGSTEARMCASTAHAVKNGAYQNDEYTVNGTDACWWWLRSPGHRGDFAARVSIDGRVRTFGLLVDLEYEGVRPVVVLRLS